MPIEVALVEARVEEVEVYKVEEEGVEGKLIGRERSHWASQAGPQMLRE